MRQEAIKQAEKERREKYKKQEEDREHLRQGIREKVKIGVNPVICEARTYLKSYKFQLPGLAL